MNNFPKQERIVSKKLIDKLFGSKHQSAVVYPIRVVYMQVDEDTAPPLQVLISVSKRHFKHAVDRNRTKRQIREAYRNNKHIIYDALETAPDKPRHIAMAYIWLADELRPSGEIEISMQKLLTGIAETIQRCPQNSGNDIQR